MKITKYSTMTIFYKPEEVERIKRRLQNLESRGWELCDVHIKDIPVDNKEWYGEQDGHHNSIQLMK